LYAEPAAQVRTYNTLSLIKTISTTLFDVSEPQVAEKKIHWWHEELERLANRSARHPDCVAVQDYLNSKQAANSLLSILSAAANERYSPLSSDHDLNEMIVADYAARLSLLDHVQTLEAAEKSLETAPEKTMNTVALGLGQMHRLCTLAERLQHGYAVYSNENYTRYDATPEQLHKNKINTDKSSAGAIINAAIEQTSHALTQSVEELRSEQHPSPASMPVHIMSELRLAQIRLWQKKKPDLLHEYMALTPLRKFFIANRCKRKFAKSLRHKVKSAL